uniref:Aprataxin C2HE/C2H2/C2HC zinc finger domain-containing protein n=1 Tax=Glossina brevipalpis TaxID=37001 RepID=A0A1A9W9D6_9MUSC
MSNWSSGLINILKDPSKHIIASNLAVVIKDKYPKAKHHYLVLPLSDIDTIFHLTIDHLDLVEELYLLAINIIELKREDLNNFQIGFHNQPSMQRVHMHVISKDFISDCLKTKKHWNSFNTKLFLPYEELCQQLKICGRVKPLTKIELEKLTKQELQCNQCSFKPKTMPSLKEHLYDHCKK